MLNPISWEPGIVRYTRRYLKLFFLSTSTYSVVDLSASTNGGAVILDRSPLIVDIDYQGVRHTYGLIAYSSSGSIRTARKSFRVLR